MRLTDITVRNLPAPPAGQKVYYDDAFPNFGCRISQGGTRSFVVRHGEDRQLITLGRYPILTLSVARHLARERLAEIILGKHRPKSVRWDRAVEDYLAHCEEKNRPNTVKGYKRILNKHMRFGARRLSEVSYDDLKRRLDRLVHVPGERNHTLTTVKVFLNWALEPPRRYILHNPLEGVSPSYRPPRKRKLTDPELVNIYRAALEGTDVFSHIVALLVLMGQRRGETGALRRSWFNTAEQTITIPATVTKNKTEHTFPYGHGVAHILAKLPDSGDYLFPAGRDHVRGKPTACFNGWTKAKSEFDARCGVTDWTLHDLRKKFATTLAALKVSPHIIEKLLNHKFGVISNKTGGLVSDVAEVYNLHHYLPEMRDAIDKWEAKLRCLIEENRLAA